MTSMDVAAPAGKPQPFFDPAFSRKVADALNDPFTQMQLLNQFWDYLWQRIATGGIPVPVSQIVGFSRYVASPATTILGAEGTTSVTYTDLATVGPTLSGLSRGQYLVLFGATINNNVSTGTSHMSVAYNSTAASTDDEAQTQGSPLISTSRAIVLDLPDDSNSVTAKYKSGAVTDQANFEKRWLIALRIANL